MIGMLGLHEDFHGKPEGVARSERYSTRVFEDVLAKAARRMGRLPVIGLYVHERNLRAMRLYENFGFVRFDHVNWLNPRSNRVYHGMVLILGAVIGGR